MRVAMQETGARLALRGQGYLPAVEAAEKLGFTVQTLYNWADAKPPKIKALRLGGRERWVEWESITRFFKQVDPEAARLAGLT